MREKIIMVCEECLNRNYSTYKNKQANGERLALNKFCKSCNRHTVHRETR